MLYHIKGWGPRREMNGAGFSIMLYPEWKELVARQNIDQAKCDHLCRESLGPLWLEQHGYDGDYAKYQLSVRWGEWGPEHIQVPGSAAGLNNDRYCQMHAPEEGVILTPHNVDTIQQASLCLTVFCWIADYMILEEDLRQREVARKAA